MTDYVLKAEAGHLLISPFGFITYSEDFYDACCSHETERPFSPAKYYMACRSIELSLKAFLLIKGVTRKDLMKRSLGHDLHKIVKKCKELSIHNIVNISQEQEDIIEALNKWYARKGFEYFEIENLTSDHRALPEINVVKQLAKSLIDSLSEPCRDAANQP